MASNVHSGGVRIVFHPSAGNGAGFARAKMMAASLNKKGVHSELVDSSIASDPRVSEPNKNYRAFIIVGGDGLIHRMISQIIGSKLPVGIIPAGSGNDLWRMNGHSGLKESIDSIASFCHQGGNTVPIDVMEVRFANFESQPKYAVGAVSWGAEAKINAVANGLPRQLGALRYIVGLVLTIPRLRGSYTAVTSDGLRFDGPVLAASIANIRSLGGGITLFPQADFSDGCLELAMVRGTRILPALREVGKILRGVEHPMKVIGTLSSARIQTQQDSYGDGEYLGTGNFKVQVIPGAIDLTS